MGCHHGRTHAQRSGNRLGRVPLSGPQQPRHQAPRPARANERLGRIAVDIRMCGSVSDSVIPRMWTATGAAYACALLQGVGQLPAGPTFRLAGRLSAAYFSDTAARQLLTPHSNSWKWWAAGRDHTQLGHGHEGASCQMHAGSIRPASPAAHHPGAAEGELPPCSARPSRWKQVGH